MRLTFEPEVEAFRAEFLEWFTANRPTAEEMAADPMVSSTISSSVRCWQAPR